MNTISVKIQNINREELRLIIAALRDRREQILATQEKERLRAIEERRSVDLTIGELLSRELTHRLSRKETMKSNKTSPAKSVDVQRMVRRFFVWRKIRAKQELNEWSIRWIHACAKIWAGLKRMPRCEASVRWAERNNDRLCNLSAAKRGLGHPMPVFLGGNPVRLSTPRGRAWSSNNHPNVLITHGAEDNQ